MPTPKTTECFKLLSILCHRRITVYAKTNTIPPTRIDQIFSGTSNLLKFFRNQHNQVAALSNQNKGMLIQSLQKQEVLRCQPALKKTANNLVSADEPEEMYGQLWDKFRSLLNKDFQKVIATFRELLAFKNSMQQDRMLILLIGSSANCNTRQKLEALKISAQDACLLNRRLSFLMAVRSATALPEAIA